MGHPILEPTWQGDLLDCPRCKSGTPSQIFTNPRKWRCEDCGYEFIKMPANGMIDDVLGLRALEQRWLPDPKVPGCGTLYVLADGNERDLARYSTTFTLLIPPITDKRFVHTSPGIDWWNPPTSPTEVYCHATLDHPPASPDARSEYEFVITSKGQRVYYEQRTLPLRAKSPMPGAIHQPSEPEL